MADIEMADESIIELHPSWDAALIVSHNNPRKKFLVSSHILRVASRYFNSLLASKFEEGAKIQSGSKPDITLHDDNPEAMEMILSILHYKYQDKWYTLSARMVSVVAMQCDKYDCAASLRPWVNQWLANFGQVERGDVGYLLVATASLGEAAKFQKMSKAAVLQLPMNFDFKAWSEDEVLSALPDGETIIDLDQNQSEIGLMDTSRCSNGQNLGVGDFPVVCSSETRVAECTRMFTKLQLYPNEKAWREGTIAEIALRFNIIRETSTHRCDFDQRCPLKKRLVELDNAVVEVIDGIRGWKLKPLAADDATANADCEDKAIKGLECEGL
ncbi:hypothetical protein BDP55DRAFT_701371 [Colletotrichum godetiae]|uniref:BTB domain-containing protein n=1 Tax=Colletotrichum godetiae TaxID=1209918 RepID=A0AAJ0AXX1_9PEZI|nr:uncharacterized protein BDP55DRAFT_701371 [Colletotrichum godetiae]KAK1690139.1 hypothetical protein BDP55DRAFT_701371 [Colletotrichum godetiae]